MLPCASNSDTDPDKIGAQPNNLIRIIPDKINLTNTIGDPSTGMTKNDLINNLGTIAKLLMRRHFMEAWASDGDISMIGQFGVDSYVWFIWSLTRSV